MDNIPIVPTFDEYRVGGKNQFGNIISKIYVRSEGKYLIYKCNKIDDIFFDGNDSVKASYANIHGKVATIFGRFHSEFKNHPQFIDQIVFAIVECIDGNKEEAFKILDNLEKRILYFKKCKGRIFYLLGGLCLVIFNIIVTLYFKFYRPELCSQFEQSFIVLSVITSGSLGGFLSISININKFKIDSDSGLLNNMAAGLIRIAISMICSFFIYYVLKSEIILGIINDLSSVNDFMIALGFISGFSETFVPNIINKVESKHSDVSM